MNDAKDMIEQARELARKSFLKNGSPPWELTELVADKGKELSRIFGADEKIVVISLYLSHIVFSPVWKGDIQKNHTELSAQKAKIFLDTLRLTEKEKSLILDSIRSHHEKGKSRSKEAEIMKNAECFKFVSLKGALIYLHELGRRDIEFDEAMKMVLEKMEQKRALISLNIKTECEEIERIMQKTKA